MPLLDANQVGFKTGAGFTYQGTRIDKVGNAVSENTLVTIAVDRSSSVDNFEAELEKCVQEIVAACQKSPRAEQLQIRILKFGSDVVEHHGYRMLSTLNPNDYKNFLACGGSTALFDATYDAATATLDYAHNLSTADVQANGIMFVLTDGENNNSTRGVSDVAAAIQAAKHDKTEKLESFLAVLVGVNTYGGGVSSYLTNYQSDAGFDEYVDIAKADAKSLAKLAHFVSQSIVSQSKSIGSGSAGVLPSMPTF